MKKEDFNYLYSFKYKGKDYIYLTSENCPFYFLEYDFSTKKFDYPDIDIFKELYKKFYLSDDILAFDKDNKLKKIIKSLSEIKISIKPLVKTASGLIALTIALSMCGCAQVPIKNDIQEPTAVVEYQSTRDDEISDYFSEYDIDVVSREYDGNDYIFAVNFVNSSGKHQITINDFQQFRDVMQINFTPTWDDVEEAFKNNKSIDAEIKTIILDCLENMKNSEDLKEMDLSVLYANAKRMNFEYLSSDEISKKVERDSVYAYFDTRTGTIYLPNDKPLEKFELVHEVLGHGSLSYREEKGDNLYIFDCTNYIMLPTNNTYNGYSMGTTISEGGANIIAHIATKDYSVDNFYQIYEEELRVIAELCHVSIGELFNHKGVSLYDLMYQNKINTPVEYIFKMDGIFKGKKYCEFSDLMQWLFKDATEENFINSTPEEQDKIIRDTVDIIRNSQFKDKKGLHFDYTGGSIDYDFEKAAEDYTNTMNDLRGSK